MIQFDYYFFSDGWVETTNQSHIFLNWEFVHRNKSIFPARQPSRITFRSHYLGGNGSSISHDLGKFRKSSTRKVLAGKFGYVKAPWKNIQNNARKNKSFNFFFQIFQGPLTSHENHLPIPGKVDSRWVSRAVLVHLGMRWVEWTASSWFRLEDESTYPPPSPNIPNIGIIRCYKDT